MSNLLNVKQAAERLNVAEKTIYNQVCKGTLKVTYVKIGKLIRFRPEDIEKFIERRTVKPSFK